MDKPVTRTEPLPDLAAGLQLQAVAVAPAAERPEIAAQLDRYDIAVILKASYQWGGFRYSNAGDAIAAAKGAAR